MKGSGLASVVAVMVFLGVIGVTVVEAIFDGLSIWDVGVIGLGLLGVLVVLVAWIIAIARR